MIYFFCQNDHNIEKLGGSLWNIYHIHSTTEGSGLWKGGVKVRLSLSLNWMSWKERQVTLCFNAIMDIFYILSFSKSLKYALVIGYPCENFLTKIPGLMGDGKFCSCCFRFGQNVQSPVTFKSFKFYFQDHQSSVKRRDKKSWNSTKRQAQAFVWKGLYNDFDNLFSWFRLQVCFWQDQSNNRKTLIYS